MREIKKGKLLVAGALVLVVIAAAVGVAASKVSSFNRPEDAYWAAIRTSLDTPAVTCTLHKQEKELTTDLVTSLDLLSKSNLRAQTKLTQNGTVVETETIETKTDQFVRYTDIKPASGGTADFSKVLNVWSKQPRNSADDVPLYDKTALGGCIVPLADLPADQLDNIMATIKSNDLFKTDFSKAGWRWSLTNPELAYDVSVPANYYVLFMQDIGARQGLNGLEQLDSTPYMKRDAPPAKLRFTVDARSQRLKQIKLQSPDTTFSFSDYGKLPDTSPPGSPITSAELQKRLQSAQ